MNYYRNTSPGNLEGERWKDVPGYEGTYKVSNLGRVKSLDRHIAHPRLGTQFVKGRILTQKVIRNVNTKVGKPSIDLQVAFTIEGRTRYYNVRRLVYGAFKNKRLNYKADGLYVVNKNGNGYNNTVGNVILMTSVEKSMRAFARDRVPESYLKYADRSTWTKPHGGALRRKPVKQYSLKGKLVAVHESIRAASRSTGFGQKEIINAAKGRWKQYRGFKWKYD
jgi:hypothetical protein